MDLKNSEVLYLTNTKKYRNGENNFGQRGAFEEMCGIVSIHDVAKDYDLTFEDDEEV